MSTKELYNAVILYPNSLYCYSYSPYMITLTKQLEDKRRIHSEVVLNSTAARLKDSMS